MMYNRHAVAREVHVNLEAVGPKRQPEIEGVHRVFGREISSPAVRKDERTVRGEEWVYPRSHASKPIQVIRSAARHPPPPR